MKIKDEDTKAAIQWAKTACTLMSDAVEQINTFHGLLLMCKSPNPFSHKHDLVSMADCPKDLQSAAVKLHRHYYIRPEYVSDLGNTVKVHFPEFLVPIKCPEYYVLSAIEAAPIWAEAVLRAVQIPLLWLTPNAELQTSEAPNWASATLSPKEFKDYVACTKDAKRRFRFANRGRLQWLLALIERETLMLEKYEATYVESE